MAKLKALQLSDKDLDALSIITGQDIIIAQGKIAKALDKKYKNLLLAKDSELEKAENENE